MKFNKLSSLILVLSLFGCNSIQPVETAELLSTPILLPENTTEITAISKDSQIILKGFQGYVFWLVWSKGGKRLFVGTEKSGVIVYDLIHKKAVANFYKDLPEGLVIQNLALSPDEKTLAVVIYSENIIRLIDPKTGNQIKTLNIPQYWPGGLTFSPDSKVLASVNTRDKKVILWDVASGEKIKELSVDNHWIGRLWFTPDGTALIAHSTEDTFEIWDTTTWQTRETFRCESSGFSTFSPDGNKFVSIGAGDDIKANSIWEFRTCKKLFDLNGAQPWISAIAYEPNGKYVAVGGSGGDDNILHTITVWDPNTGEHVRDLVTGYYATTTVLAFSPDGTKLASGGYAPKNIAESEIIIWDMNQP